MKNYDRILYILQEIKRNCKEPDWLSMKAKINLVLWNIDKRFFLEQAKYLTGLKYYKFFIPMIKDEEFNRLIEEIWSDTYDTSKLRDFTEFSKRLAKKFKKCESTVH